ncbi:TonB-dependent receptor [Sphingomonas sp. S1-29]|uniref:TonB-dependent receptor n=1 Tax=Sphingomonas sp. S1-29 TaxID=2991074 RepID=UPI00223EF865|nr:TonB-dependent receptor [Sphingomonas sp. S1-29]UZK70283.1 TonB-dependent receptor [Sphingomonas sp. S1-29]
MIFRDAQGNPLPPEVQRQLEERFRNNPPAQTGQPPARNGDIVVTSDRARGAVIGDVPAERSFDMLSVRAFGATDVSELLEAIAPQARSNRGRSDAGPVTLLNGRRVSSFAEIARIPTEAIERMDVFPEELALRYGFRADQKVVNIVTLPNFRSLVTQATALVPTEGGTATGGLTADQLILSGDTRLGIGASYNRTSSLLESERELLQPGGAQGSGNLRTLLPQAERFSLNGVIGAPLTTEIGASLNAQFEASDLTALLGPAALDQPLERSTRSRRGRIGTVFDGRVGRWLWSFTGGYDRTAVTVLTDGNDPMDSHDRVRSVNAIADADLIMSGPLFTLPAGSVTASIGGGVGTRDFRGSSDRDDVFSLTRLGRDRAAARGSVDVPITSAGAIGTLSANISAEVERLSDVGTLSTAGAALTWSPISSINLVASVTQEEGAPTVEQLGAPTIVTPAFRFFDFASGTSVDVPRVFGGNADLVADDRRVLRIALNVAPIKRTDLFFSVDYVDTRIDNPIAAFPVLTPALESAFPNRFSRDTAGRLTTIDARPINFAQSTTRQLRTGINFTRPLGDPTAGLAPGTTMKTRVFSSAAEAEAHARRQNPNATVVFASAEPGSAAARRGETMRSRFYVSLYHNWTLTDSLTLVEGGPTLDRLDGFATDLRGGRRGHEIEFQIGVFKKGLGARLGVNWQSATRISGLGGTGDLAFADFGRVDLNLFLNPAERFGGAGAPAWIKRTRVTLGVGNLLNARPQVRDQAGATPIAFQPALLDPLGRTVNLTLRKAF